MVRGEGNARLAWGANRAGEGAGEYSRDRLELNHGADFRLLGCDRHFRDHVRHLHRLGPRPVGHLLLEVARDPQRLMPLLDDAKRWSPEEIAQLDARDWPEPPLWGVP
mgnify:CR=1 FL=1